DVPPFFGCSLLARTGLVVGGPDWIRTEMWDVEAAIPEGSFSAIPNWYDPKLLQMLQTLLSERLKVIVRREAREIPVYLLKVGKNGARFNGHGERYKRMATYRDDDGNIKSRPLPESSILTSGKQYLDAWNT